MKKILFVLLLSLSGFVFAASQGSANYYLAEPSKYMDKIIRLVVTGGTASPIVSPDSNYVVFILETKEGNMLALVPIKSSKSFAANLPKNFTAPTGEKVSGSSKSYTGVMTSFKEGDSLKYAVKMR